MLWSTQTMTNNMTLGIDLGNTITREGSVLPHAFRVIRRLIHGPFGDRVHIVSKVDEAQEVRAREFVLGIEFQGALGIPLSRVHFCRERSDKGPICARLGVTHFIDDRPEVMAHMPTTVIHKILFNPTPGELEIYRQHLGQFLVANDWFEVEQLFFPD